METNNEIKEGGIFPKGERGAASYFTGITWVTPLVQKGADINYTVSNVVFEPGARTNWHTHPAGQILLITDGQGFYQEKNEPARELQKGDVVNIPAGIEHWHGATHSDLLVHIAISNYKEDVNVNWLQPVTEEEYATVTK